MYLCVLLLLLSDYNIKYEKSSDACCTMMAARADFLIDEQMFGRELGWRRRGRGARVTILGATRTEEDFRVCGCGYARYFAGTGADV